MAIPVFAAAAGPTVSRPHLCLLNCFELVAQGCPVRLPLSAQRLLVFLALQDRPAQRPYVAYSLWLDSPEERALANLRSALWRLHKQGLKLVIASGNRLSLDDSVLVDFREAEAFARRIADPPSEAGDLDFDLSLLEADLLPDWYEDWLIFERERYRQLRLHALETLCERLTKAGRLDVALQAGLAAVAAEPLRESAHLAVIHAHLAEGNVCEAIRQFDLCRRQMLDHLGIEPSARMRELAGLSAVETVR